MTVVPSCTHIKPDGVCCGSPAMRGRPFCFFHRRYYEGTAIRPDRMVPARDFPLIRDERDILTAITSLTRYTHEGLLTAEQANTVMRGLNLADAICKQIRRNSKRKKRH